MTHPVIDYFDTGANVLAQRGIQMPGAVLGVKYSYWTGVELSVLKQNGTPYQNAVGNVTNPPLLLGRLAGLNTSITYSQFGFTTVIVTWVILSNGDIKIECN